MTGPVSLYDQTVDPPVPIGASATRPLYTTSVGQGGSTGTSGFANFATSQVVANTSTANQLVAARTGRGAVTITNITGAQQVFLGTSAAVTTGTGTLLPATVGASITIPTTAAIFGISATAAQTVSILETF